MKKTIVLLSFLTICISSIAQTIGLKYNTAGAYDGYTLFSPYYNTTTFLINNCGEVVNSWACDDTPYYTGYLMDNGNLIRFGGSFNSNAEYIEMRDWNNNVLWKWYPPAAYEYIHSDLAIMPNGNFILIKEDRLTPAEWITLGGDPTSLSNNYTALEALIEVQPVGATGANVVWEWHMKDHLVQDFDPTKANYGVISDYPERWNINIPSFTTGAGDQQHFNGMDYHPGKDQIVFSCWSCSEIMIIDHSTTTAEAASSIGGAFNMGGDFLYRYGNPQNYGQGTSADRVFYGQHNADWISPNLPHGDKISVFENGNGRPSGAYTRGVILNPPTDAAGVYQKDVNGRYLPTTFDYQWNGVVDGVTFYSQYMGGVNMQPNGNLTFCEAMTGRFFEVDPAGNVVWSYQNPARSSIYSQGQSPNSMWCYRAEKYPPSHPAFVGRDLTPQGIIEDQNTASDNCEIFANIDCSSVTASFTGLPTISSDISPIPLTGTPAGGTFSGPGVVFNAFNPAIAGPGTHAVTYTYTDANNCQAIETQNILVFSITYNFVNYNLGTISP